MKQFAVIAFLLFCSQTLAQTQKGSLEFASSPIEINSTNKIICKIVNYPLDLKNTPNVKVIVSANFSNEIVHIGEWSLDANNSKHDWDVSFKSIDEKTSKSKDVLVIHPSQNLNTSEFQLDLKLNKKSAKGNYFCTLKKEVSNKSEVLLESETVSTIPPLHTAELTVSTTKFTIEKQFTVDCKTTTDKNHTKSEIVQVTFYKNDKKLAVYDIGTNETLKPFSDKTLTIFKGTNKQQTDYQILVKPLTKDAAGKYSCVATAKTIKDNAEERSYESNVIQVNNSARWTLPSITILLINLAFFLHF